MGSEVQLPHPPSGLAAVSPGRGDLLAESVAIPGEAVLAVLVVLVLLGVLALALTAALVRCGAEAMRRLLVKRGRVAPGQPRPELLPAPLWVLCTVASLLGSVALADLFWPIGLALAPGLGAVAVLVRSRPGLPGTDGG